ncbi:MAG: hypothetical protein RSE01_04875 [Akkermansia sp.]
MGLFQDQTNSLSEIKRLAALVMDPMRRDEIGDDQWPLAMIAYGLVNCNNTDPHLLQEGIEIYHLFQEQCSFEARNRCLRQLAQFVSQRQGNGWRSLLPFALADKESSVRKQAAFLVATLTPSMTEERFMGISALCKLILSPSLDGRQDNVPLFDAMLSLSDLRISPYLATLRDQCSASLLRSLIDHTTATPNALSCQWMIDTLENHAELSEAITTALVNMAPRAEEIMDIIIPIPSWQFKSSGIQALHGWTRPEYFARMQSRLTPLLSPEALETIRLAWA